MLEPLQKHLRAFKRDYWQATKPSSSLTLAREMRLSAAIMVTACAGLGFFMPAIIPALALFAGLTVPSMLFIRVHEMKKEMLKTDSALLPLEGDPHAGGTLTALLTGPARQIHIVINTQRMVHEATRQYGEYVMPDTVLKNLSPYFNDCAKAASQLDAALDGKPLDSISLTRTCVLKDDYGAGPTLTWHSGIHGLETRHGTEKKLAAERLAIAAVAATAVQDGLSQRLTVRPIKLKNKKP